MAAKKTPTARGKVKKTKLTGPPRKPAKYLRTVRAGGNAPDDDSEGLELELGPELVSDDPVDDPGAGPSDDFEDLPQEPRRRMPPAPPRGRRLPTIFPNPGGFKLSWDKFHRYWEQCHQNPELRPRLKVYGYRTFPVMLEDNRRVFIGVHDPSEDPAAGEIPNKPLTIDDVARMFGSGDYHFKINDRGANNQPICNCNLLGRGPLADFNTYPPILDIGVIDPAHPSNATYIKQMKAKKNWGSEEEEKKTMEQVDKLLDRLDRANERLYKSREHDRSSSDEGRAAEVVAHGAKRALDLVADAASRTSGGGDSGIQTFVGVATALAELLKSTKGEPGQLETIMAVYQKASDAERQVLTAQLDMMREELRASREERKQDQVNRNPAVTGEPDDPFKNLRQLAELREIFQDTFQPGSQRSSKFNWFEALAPMAMQVISPLAQAATYYFQAQAARSSGQAPPPPPDISQQPGMNPAQLPQPQGQTPNPQGQQDFQQFMAELTPRILRFINDPERSGADFADFFLDWQGDATYDQLTQIAPTPQESVEAVLMQLRTYEPLWRNLASREQYVRQFLYEFLTAFDEATDQEPAPGPQAMPNGHDPMAGTVAPESQVTMGSSGSVPGTTGPPPGWQPNHESTFGPDATPAPRARTKGGRKKTSATPSKSRGT